VNGRGPTASDRFISDEMIDSIYDGLVAIRPAPGTLETIRAALRADAVVLHFAVAIGATASLVETVGQEDLTRQGNAGDCSQLVAAGEGWQICCLRAPEETPFGEEEDRNFRELAAHVRRAMRVRNGLLEDGAAVHALSGVIDQLGIGAMIVRSNGRMMHADARAEAILKERDGLHLIGDRLSAASAQEGRSLEALLRAVSDDERPSAAITITRPSGRPALGLTINRPPMADDLSTIGLVVSIRDPGKGLVQSADTLRDLYGLTGTEAQLTIDLVNGKSVQETEERRGISHNTMRAHLRSIYAKLGVGRLSELIHVVSSGTSPLAPGRDRAVSPPNA